MLRSLASALVSRKLRELFCAAPAHSPSQPPDSILQNIGRLGGGVGWCRPSETQRKLPVSDQKSDRNCGPRRRDHQHRAVAAQHLIIEIDADHGIGPQLRRAQPHLAQRLLARALQHILIG
jgi:hypothetical protein